MLQVIESLTIDNMKEQNKQLINNMDELQIKYEELLQKTERTNWPRRQNEPDYNQLWIDTN